MVRDNFNQWLRAPLLTGHRAIFCVIIALALPTLVRAAVNGVVTGCEFTPYLPFVFVCAVMLRWWQAGAVALASVAILGGLFEGPPRHMLALPCFLPSAGIFLAASAGMIAMAVLVRQIIARMQRPDDFRVVLFLAWRRARSGRAGMVTGCLCGWETDKLSPT